MSYYNNNNTYDNQGHSNDYYNQHPHEYQNTYQGYSETIVHPADNTTLPENGDKGVLGAIGGGIGGGIIGKQTKHGFLGTVGGALVGSLTEDFIKKRHSRPSSPQPPNATATASATATAIANSNGGYTPMATPVSPPIYHGGHSPAAPYAAPVGVSGHTSTTTVATSYFQQPPCVGTANPCPGQVHHCMPAHGHGHGHHDNHNHHGGHHSWGTWHK